MAVQEADLNLQAEPASTNVYIGNISAEVTDAELKQLADQYGVVVDMRLHRKGGFCSGVLLRHGHTFCTLYLRFLFSTP